MITTQSSISLTRQAVPPIIQAVQGDSGRNILFNLRDETIPEGATAAFYIAKPSGEFVYNVATVQDAHTVLVPLDAQCIIEPGENRGQVRISANDEVVTSFDFILDVQKFYGMDAAQSGSESSLFEQIVEEYEDSAKAYAKDSEAFARGTRNNSPVGSTDPAYHDNSKYYKDLAETAKTAAETAASNASASETSAAASAEAAAAIVVVANDGMVVIDEDDSDTEYVVTYKVKNHHLVATMTPAS